MDYGIFKHYLLFLTIVLPWIGLSSHEYPHLEPMLSLDTHAATVLGTGESFLAIFHTKLSLILVSFYKLSLYKTPRPYGVSLGPGLTP